MSIVEYAQYPRDDGCGGPDLCPPPVHTLPPGLQATGHTAQVPQR